MLRGSAPDTLVGREHALRGQRLPGHEFSAKIGHLRGRPSRIRRDKASAGQVGPTSIKSKSGLLPVRAVVCGCGGAWVGGA